MREKGSYKVLSSTSNNEKIAYIMIAPFFIFFLTFVIVPIFTNFYYSFTNYDLYKTRDFIGFRNYIDLLSDNLFLRSASNTLFYAIFSVIVLVIIGIIFAVMLNRTSIIIKIQRIFFFIPYITSMVAVSMIWMLIFDPSLGILNKLLYSIGLSEKLWLFDPKLALYCLIFVNFWKNLGYIITLYLAGLQNIPSYYYESAEIDGASGIRKFFSITVPLISPTTYFILLTTCIDGLKAFEQINIMTGGGPAYATTTMVHQIYITGFQQNKMGYAAAMSMILLLIVVVITVIFNKFWNKHSEY